MNKIDKYTIEEALDSAGQDYEEVIYAKYSGRFMYGETCFGVVLNNQRELTDFMVEISRLDEDLYDGLNAAQRSDNMGLDMIYYFPGYRLEER